MSKIMTNRDWNPWQYETEMNRAEVAEFYGASLPTIDAWVRKGCPYIEKGSRGRPYRFNLGEVMEWRIEEMKRTGEYWKI